MQTKEELEAHYQNTDPWGYQTHPDDAVRKEKILSVVRRSGHVLYPHLSSMIDLAKARATDLTELRNVFARALDLGAGEGWITADLPADEIHGYELSDAAASRFPQNVRRVGESDLSFGKALGHDHYGKYDLIVASGVMYHQYDNARLIEIIKEHSSGMVVLCNIADWEVSKLKELGEPVWVEEFPYRDYVERIRVYQKPPRSENPCWYCSGIMKEISEDPDDEGMAGGDPDQHFAACPVQKLIIQWANR